MKINKNNFFIYTLLFTSIIVTIYFYFFSNRNIHVKFIYERKPASAMFESYKDYENLKKVNDFYLKEFNEEYFYMTKYQNYSDNLTTKIVRFLENNKNYKYEYKNFKKLSNKEFKKLEKILNNVSLEGAYFLQPEHIDKVTINLFLSKLDEEEIFLNYFKFITKEEAIKTIGFKKKIQTPSNLQIIDSKFNLFRDLHYRFLKYLKFEIKKNKNIFDQIDQVIDPTPEEIKNKVNQVSLINIDSIVLELECPFSKLRIVSNCKILSETSVKSMSTIFEKFSEIGWIDQEYSTKNNALRYLIHEFSKETSLPRDIILEYMNYGFSEKYLKDLMLISKFQKLKSNLNTKYNHTNFNLKNYDLEIIVKNFSNINKVETKSNHLELFSYLVFALMFSFVSQIIYRSFSRN